MDEKIFREINTVEDSSWWYKGMRDIYGKLLNQTFSVKNGSVLDIGCGTGFNASLFNNFNNIYGLDNSPEAIKYCSERKKMLRFISGDAAFLPFRSSAFNLICAFGVIEHIDKEESMLKEMFRCCKKNGFIFIMTSAYPFLWTKHDFKTGHKRRYYIGDLRYKVEKSGFEICRISYINFFLLPFIAIGTALYNIRNAFSKRDMGIYGAVNPPRFINEILYSMLRMEANLMRYMNLPCGAGIVCLAEKRKTG